jgi:hypothetical protein
MGAREEDENKMKVKEVKEKKLGKGREGRKRK